MMARWPELTSSVNTAASPPIAAATAAGRVVMAGTSSTRNTRGIAKSSGSESGTAEPTSTPTTVKICQLAPQQ